MWRGNPLEGGWAALGAVDRDVGAVDPVGAVGEEEGDNIGNLFGLAKAAPGEFSPFELGEPLRVGGTEALPATAREQDRAGAEGVDPDSLRRQLPGQGTGQEDLGGLGRAVLGAGAGLPARDRRDDDDGATAPGGQVRDRGANRPDGVKGVQVEGPGPVFGGRLEQSAASCTTDVGN